MACATWRREHAMNPAARLSQSSTNDERRTSPVNREALSMRDRTWNMVCAIAVPSVLMLVIGCTHEATDINADEGPALGTVTSELVACAGTGDVAAVTNAIAANCGGVAGCSNTTSTHND